MKLLTRATVMVAVLLMLVIASSSQNNVAKPDQNATITGGADLVLVPTVVTGKDGKPVRDLKQSDFVLLENGKERLIAGIEFVEASRTFTPAQAPAGVFTNMKLPDGAPRRLTIIVLDSINTPAMDQTYGRQELIRYLRTGLNPNEAVTVLVAAPSGLQIVHEFSKDTASLIASLEKVQSILARKGEVDRVTDDMSLSKAAEDDGGAFAVLAALKTDNELGRVTQEYQVRRSIEYLAQLAYMFGGIPGRKSMVWVSAGFPFMIDKLENYTERDYLRKPVMQVFETLAHANIAVYPVSPAGLLAPEQQNISMAVTGNRLGTQADMAWAREQSAEANPRNDTMRTVAAVTGGKYYHNTNDLKEAFGDAAEDSGGYYILAYALPRDDSKPGWRKLEVKVKRNDTRVRARGGFFRAAPHNNSSVRQFDLKAAALAPVDYTGVPFSVLWEPAAGEGARKQANFKIILAPSATALDGESNMNMDIAALVTGPDGKPAGRYGKTLEMPMDAAGADQYRKRGFIYRDFVELKPGAYRVKFIVRDNITGRMGTVTARLQLD